MSASSPAAHEYNAEIGVLRFPRRKIGQQRRLPEGNHLRAGEVLRHGVIALLFKLRQRTALQRRRARLRRSGEPCGGVQLRKAAAAVFRHGQQRRRLRFAALKERARKKACVFPHPQGANQAA